jgi:hypothetical protein
MKLTDPHVPVQHCPLKTLSHNHGSHGVNRFVYGDVICGIALGSNAELTVFTKDDNDKTVKTPIYLPRRAVYVFSGEARDLKFSIRNTGTDINGLHAKRPAWNEGSARRGTYRVAPPTHAPARCFFLN